jgi:FkbM family methyltransferase
MMTPSYLKHCGRLLLKPNYRRRHVALKRLQKKPRYTAASTNLLGTEMKLVDTASFLFMYQEIFERQIYRFKAIRKRPVIIDCGANIGLSVLYFKQLYPDSRVTAFEPDKKIFDVLKKNMQAFELSDVELIDKAVWRSDEVLKFWPEGADGGRILPQDSVVEYDSVEAVRLRPYLSQPVDFLKLDIEGAESEVLKDCRDLLFNVTNLFVEYHSFADQVQSFAPLINVLCEAGFRLHFHPSGTSLQPFYHRTIRQDMDGQVNIFAFREAPDTL